jgi:acyl transferase domain-containing protein
VGNEPEQVLSALDALSRGADHPPLAHGHARTEQRPVFLFPGQGSQWLGMGAELAKSSAVFAASLDECEEAFAPYVDFSVRDVVTGVEGAASIERIEVVQPALFATMVSLARVWRACGVKPAAVIGHSQGEIAAAHVAGGLSLDDAARLAALRSGLISRLAGQGAMASVALAPQQVVTRIEAWEGIEVAAQNGPSSTILSAERDALGEFLAECEKEGIRAREIPATIPSHSARVEPLREELAEALSPISPLQGEIPFYSTVTGGLLDSKELGPEYWYRNLREPVLFETVTRALLDGGARVFVEISPHPVFALAVQETIEDALGDREEASVLGTLRRDEGGAERFALSLAEAHCTGVKLDWQALFAGSGAKAVPLPTYAFQRERYWMSASQGSGDVSAAGQTSADHPLLGAIVEDPQGDRLTLTGRISLDSHPWLADHAVAGVVLMPGTAFVELALRAGEAVGAKAIEELTLKAPLILPETGAVALQVMLAGPDEQGRREISIHSRPEGRGEEELAEPQEWTSHAQGVLTEQAPATTEPLEAWPPEGAEPLDVGDLYESLADLGFEYGPTFQGLTAAWQDGEQLYAEVSLPAEQREEGRRFALHPALLDASLHGLAASLAQRGEGEEKIELPFSWHGVAVAERGAGELRVRISPAEDGAVAIVLDSGWGAPVAEVRTLATRPLELSELREAERPSSDSLYDLHWSKVEASTSYRAFTQRLAILGELAIYRLEAEQ